MQNLLQYNKKYLNFYFLKRLNKSNERTRTEQKPTRHHNPPPWPETPYTGCRNAGPRSRRLSASQEAPAKSRQMVANKETIMLSQSPWQSLGATQ